MAATLSLSTQVFAARELADALAWAAKLGLRSVEIGRRHAETLHASPAARAAARDLAGQLGVHFGSLHAWAEVDGLDRVCPTAHDLGAGLIVVHCRHERLAADLAGAAEALSRWAGWCRDRGVVLTVENSSRQPIEPFVRFFDAVPALSCTLDVKHAYKPKLFGLTHVDYMQRLGGRVANFHLLGIDPARDDLLGDGIPAGRDAIDYSLLAGDLAARDYAGLLTVESSVPDLPGEQLERAYADIPPIGPEETSIPHRLSRHNVAFFRDTFRGVIGG